MCILFRVALMVALAALCGCAGTGLVSTGTSVIEQVDQLIPELIMAKAAALHNLQIGLQQINSAPGMVTMTMPPTTVVAPAPAPVPVPPPVSIPTAPTSDG